MAANPVTLHNGKQSLTFVAGDAGYRPEWLRLGQRPMLRFKDHEWLNIGHLRVTKGELRKKSASALEFGGNEEFGGARFAWTVTVSLPEDGGDGFTVRTTLVPLDEPVELLEAMTAYETPYEYDGKEEGMTVIAQQPVYRFAGDQVVSGAGYTHPFWYYGRAGRAHLTYPSASPMLAHRVRQADGSNERCIMLLGNWRVSTMKDIFAQPTRAHRPVPDDLPFADEHLKIYPGKRGMKFLMGCVNWNNSLHKDPNILLEAGVGLSQEVLVDVRESLPDAQWDGWLAAGWERLCAVHFPDDGRVPAYHVAQARDASWVHAADWLAGSIKAPAGMPGFFYPERGIGVYSPGTRPQFDRGVPLFSAQWTGPLAYLGQVWGDATMTPAVARLEAHFNRDKDHHPEHIWTIGPTPMYCAVMRKLKLAGGSDETRRKVQDYVTRRTEVVLNPPAGGRRGDAGIQAWDAFANLLAADLFPPAAHENAARELLTRVNAKLDAEFWSFNCAAEGDLVGGGQARPFGHAYAMAANVLAHRRFHDPAYLTAAQRFGNLLLAMHYMTHNESPVPDMDTRGWAQGSTGGRDQWAQMPPWESGHSLQQFAYLLLAGKGRPGFYDVLWLHAHTGLAQFPKARTLKRLYTPDMQVVYRPIEAVATEREFYLSLPYLAYENPWDQTMLAGYQGVEPILHSLLFGGGLVAATDERVLALVPEAAVYTPEVSQQFTVELWNPTPEPVSTKLLATIAVRRNETWRLDGQAAGEVSPASPLSRAIEVPSRQVLKVVLKKA